MRRSPIQVLGGAWDPHPEGDDWLPTRDSFSHAEAIPRSRRGSSIQPPRDNIAPTSPQREGAASVLSLFGEKRSLRPGPEEGEGPSKAAGVPSEPRKGAGLSRPPDLRGNRRGGPPPREIPPHPAPPMRASEGQGRRMGLWRRRRARTGRSSRGRRRRGSSGPDGLGCLGCLRPPRGRRRWRSRDTRGT